MDILKIYALGINQQLQKEIDELESLLKDEFNDKYYIMTIDLLQNPLLTGKDKIYMPPILLDNISPLIKMNLDNLMKNHKVLIGIDSNDSL